MATPTPIAFLLVKFQGSNDEPITIAAATQMFTAAGRGTMNVVDWFDDNSHGQVDMTGNAVFGWLTLSHKQSDYKGSGANPAARPDIFTWARQAATAAGINLSPFTAVVVVTNVEVDMFGSAGNVCCTAATAGKQFWEMQAAPSVLCQEMIHGLGVNEHTRRHGSDVDYQDPYDVMSMFNANPGHHPTIANFPVGPGTNAAFMKRCTWLDASRGVATAGQVLLRPLHRRDLSGPLYLTVGPYYVEYRPSRRWDTGFSSVVLVHYIANHTSYLVAELSAGSEFTWGNPLSPFGSIKVDAIDDAAQTATIKAQISGLIPVWIGSGRIPGAGMHWSRDAVDQFVAANVDGGTDQEILIANNKNGYIGMLKWNGSALTPVWIGSGRIPGAGMHWSRDAADLFVAADVDGDTHQEILIANNSNGYIGVLKWSGSALAPVWIGSGRIQGAGMHWSRDAADRFVASDMDGDGHQEVLIANNNNGYLGLLKWSGSALAPVWIGNGRIQGAGMHWSRDAVDQFVAANVDGGADQEILIANNKNGYIGVLKWNGSALAPVWIGTGRIPGTGMHWSRDAADLFVAADVDGDGRQEILIANNQNGYIGLLKWNGSALAPVWIGSGRIEGIGIHWSRDAADRFVAADVDGDGHQEVLVANNNNGYIGMLKWNGSALAPVWIGSGRLSGAGMHWSRADDLFVAADLDGDTHQEILIANNNNGYVGVLKLKPLA